MEMEWYMNFILCALNLCFAGKILDENAAKTWLVAYNVLDGQHKNALYTSLWNYAVNITDYNQQATVDATLSQSEFQKAAALNASKFDWKRFSDENVKRQFSRILGTIGPNALKDKAKLARKSDIESEMTGIYGKGKVFMKSQNKYLSLEPGLTDLFASSRNYDELLEAWKGWRDNTGKQMKDLYTEFVELSNEGVREIGYKDTADFWRSFYESDTFQKDLEDLLEQLKPFYANLHQYVKKKLIKLYGEDKFPESGHIPAHLLGNMWAQEWNNLHELVKPYDSKSRIDVTEEMKRQKYTVERMFRIAEEFYVSLGLEPMVDAFWKYSMFTKPNDREVVCHGLAEDFYNASDFRIKLCAHTDMEDLITIHHEMGHIEYFMQYRHQPVIFREGANPGFHEAVGDVASLSVTTPAYLHKIGLLKDVTHDNEGDINYLMKMALEKVALIPFSYLIDQWRWSVFSGETLPDNYNDKWWELRCKYQGVSPPTYRSTSDFDPGAKFHIPSNFPYIRYFVSVVVQFQFHKALCNAANHKGPLYECDISGSKEAGRLFSNMLKMGTSKPWPDAMEQITGQRKMDVGPVLEYFEPLVKWLENENRNDEPGWTTACPFIGDLNSASVTTTSFINLLYAIALLSAIKCL